MTFQKIADNTTLIAFSRPADFAALTLGSRFAAVGSCFIDEIAKRLKSDGADVMRNPFGTIYNPISIYHVFSLIFGDRVFREDDILFENGVYWTPFHTTDFDADTREAAAAKVYKNLKKSAAFFAAADTFLITVGTAVVYEYHGAAVANCHKLPPGVFARRIMSADEITQTVKKTISLIRMHRPHAQIILTVSPVRHGNPDMITDGYSKALLKVGLLDALAASVPGVSYFPSYEIVLDQLRDYRYYRADGRHITDEAADYIYETFLQVFFAQSSLDAIKKIRHLQATINHKTKQKNALYYDNQKAALESLTEINRLYRTKKLNKLCDKLQRRINNA